MADIEKLKLEIRNRIDLTYLEFVRLTRDYTLPLVQKAVDELIDEGRVQENLFASSPKVKDVWTGAGLVRVSEDEQQ
jgi:hypothetical protein